MRIAHATDIHWFVPPTARDITLRRMVGTANLYLKGRRRHFDPAVQRALVEHVLALDPDLFVISGDLTAQALDTEFALAREVLDPVLQRVPTFIVPGNHDVYTPGAERSDRIGAHFGPFLHRAGAIARWRAPGLTVLGVDPNRATWFDAAGMLPQEQLGALRAALIEPTDDFVLLVCHYPVVGPDGRLYDGAHHGLRNAAALVEVLGEAPHPPHLLVHGHIHHGYQSVLPNGIPTIDCGSSGQAYLPQRGWYAAMNVITIDGQRISSVEAYHHDGTSFRLAHQRA